VPIDRDGDGFSDAPKRRLHAGGFGLYRGALGGKARFSVSTTVADEFRRGGERFDLAPHETRLTEQIASRRTAVSVRWNHTVTAKTYYNIKTSFADTRQESYFGSGYDRNAYGTTENPLWVSDLQLGRQAGRHTVLGGYQYRRERIRNEIPAYDRRYGELYADHGLYLQDEWRLGAGTILLAGLRVDRFNQLRRWIVSPRAGFKRSITGSLNWRVSLSTGFRAPEIFNEDLHVAQVGGEGLLIENSPGLREEKSVSFSTGLDYVGRVGGRPYRLGANFFWTDLRNNFQLVEVPSPAPHSRLLLRVNGPGSFVRGMDMDGSISLAAHLSLRGGVTLQVARYKEPEEQFGSLSFFRSPERYGFFGLDWMLPGRVELTSTTEFLGPMLAPHYAGYIPEDRLERTQSFVVVNTVVSKLLAVTDKARLRLFLNVNNITDSYQPDLDKGPRRDSSYVYGPTQMRRVILGLTWEF